MNSEAPPLYLYWDTEKRTPRTNRAANQDVQQYVNIGKLWHKPDEKPLARKGILVFNESEELRFITLTNAAVDSWDSFSEFAHIRAWMYTESLYNTIP